MAIEIPAATTTEGIGDAPTDYLVSLSSLLVSYAWCSVA